jgi:hypothetical protein
VASQFARNRLGDLLGVSMSRSVNDDAVHVESPPSSQDWTICARHDH